MNSHLTTKRSKHPSNFESVVNIRKFERCRIPIQTVSHFHTPRPTVILIANNQLTTQLLNAVICPRLIYSVIML